jgi:YesN/AraC family two-component response regulator
MTIFIRIYNQIVEKIENNGLKIGSIKLFEKQHKVKLNLKNIPYVFSGSRLSDSLLIQKLMDGIVKYDEMNILYPNSSKNTTFIRIDNQIIEKIENNGLKVGSIKLFEKQHKVKLNLKNIPYVFSGSRLSDSLLIQKLMDGIVKYEDLNIIYPNIYQL